MSTMSWAAFLDRGIHPPLEPANSGSEPALDKVAGDQPQQANDDQHQPPGGGSPGSVVVARLPRAFVLLHGPMVGGDPHEVNANGRPPEFPRPADRSPVPGPARPVPWAWRGSSRSGSTRPTHGPDQRPIREPHREEVFLGVVLARNEGLCLL